MLGPGDGAVRRSLVFERFRDLDHSAVGAQPDLPLEAQLGLREMSARRQIAIAGGNLITRYRGLSVHCQPRRGFLRRRRSEDIQAEVVPHDAAQ